MLKIALQCVMTDLNGDGQFCNVFCTKNLFAYIDKGMYLCHQQCGEICLLATT